MASYGSGPEGRWGGALIEQVTTKALAVVTEAGDLTGTVIPNSEGLLAKRKPKATVRREKRGQN